MTDVEARAGTFPLTDDQIRSQGFEPTYRGWKPIDAALDARLAEVVENRRSSRRPPAPIRILGRKVPCIVCDAPAEPSLVGTPTCSQLCTAIVASWVMPAIADALDRYGSRGPTLAQPTTIKTRATRAIREGVASVDRARERLGDCRSVLERHRIDVRGRMACCPFHEDRSPSLSLYERNGRSRYHCHGCGVGGDAIDLEAALVGESVTTTIRGWGR